MKVVVRGIKRYKDRHGRWRLYHRRSGTALDPSMSAAELAARVAELDRAHKPRHGASPGTLGHLLESYKRSPRFTDLAPRTKRDYNKCMDYLAPSRDMPLDHLTTGFMAKLRDRTVARRKASFTNHMIAMLSSACRHGVEYDMLDKNPCAGLQKARVPTERRLENRPWSAAERVNVLAAAPPHLKVPLALARFLGLRRGDIIRLPDMAYRDGFISLRAGKNGKLMKMPVVGRLKEILDNRPRGETVTMLCVNSRGQPWTEDGFTASTRKFFAQCVRRGIAGPRLTVHGLRHTVATELREMGYTAHQIKDYVGHDTVRMTEHYSSSADVSGVLIEMANVLQGGTKRKRKLSNPGRNGV